MSDKEEKLLAQIVILKKIIEDLESMETEVSKIVYDEPYINIDCFGEVRSKTTHVLRNQRDQLCHERGE